MTAYGCARSLKILVIGQRILTTNLRVHQNPNLRESGILQQQQENKPSSETHSLLQHHCFIQSD